jgi:hypothetical protein
MTARYGDNSIPKKSLRMSAKSQNTAAEVFVLYVLGGQRLSRVLRQIDQRIRDDKTSTMIKISSEIRNQSGREGVQEWLKAKHFFLM